MLSKQGSLCVNIHFSENELADRRARACQAMQTHGIEGLLVFRQESMFYLTGYDTIGYVFFQCLYLGADGAMFLLTRGADLRQARHTSVIEEIHVWVDEEGAEPAVELSRLLDSRGCRGKRLGVEWDAFGLTAHHGMKLRAALDGFAALEDASYLVSRLRFVKSPAELDYVRKAGELADAALAEAECLAAPGAFEGDILAAMQSAVFRGDGDYPGNEFIIGSSEGALLCRYYTGRRTLGAKDQITLEFAGVYRHYHAVLMRTVLIGEVDPRQRAMHATVVDALSACEEALCPGRAVWRCVRRPRAGARTSGLRETPTERLRLQFGWDIRPDLDGLATDIPRQSDRSGAGHGSLLLHDDLRFREWSRHDARAHLHRHGRRLRIRFQGVTGTGDEMM